MPCETILLNLGDRMELMKKSLGDNSKVRLQVSYMRRLGYVKEPINA
jgi:hypothetical protein